MESDISDSWDIIIRIFDMENDDKFYNYWLALVPKMDEDNFIEYEDFKVKMLPVKPITTKSDDEIISELMKVREKFKEREV